MLPGYAGVLGRLWLTQGGTYVEANIRGGGEYGPRWHTQAMREGRRLVYEAFAAVAADLVRRGITTVEQLAAEGGSNGGLLTSVMLTRYPDLFGAIVIDVPLADMRRSHRLLAGASGGSEYGCADVPAARAVCRDACGGGAARASRRAAARVAEASCGGPLPARRHRDDGGPARRSDDQQEPILSEFSGSPR